MKKITLVFIALFISSNINAQSTKKIAINNDGIKVNKPNDIIYFLFATDPLTLILFLIEFLISIKIKTKKTSKKIIFKINTV